MSTVTKEFRVTASPHVMAKFEKFMAMLHFNSRFGHSAAFGMWLDGDGSDKFTLSPAPPRIVGSEVNLIGGVGYDVEMACDGYYGGLFIDRKRNCNWRVERTATLFKDGLPRETYPRESVTAPPEED
jgi:hypothetical protein